MPTVGALPVAGALRGWKLVGGGGFEALRDHSK